MKKPSLPSITENEDCVLEEHKNANQEAEVLHVSLPEQLLPGITETEEAGKHESTGKTSKQEDGDVSLLTTGSASGWSVQLLEGEEMVGKELFLYPFRTKSEALKIIKRKLETNTYLSKVALERLQLAQLAVEDGAVKSAEIQKLQTDLEKAAASLDAKEEELFGMWRRYVEENRDTVETQQQLQKRLEERHADIKAKADTIDKLKEELYEEKRALESAEMLRHQLLLQEDKRKLGAGTPNVSEDEEKAEESFDQGHVTAPQDLQQLLYSLEEKDAKIKEATLSIKDLSTELDIIKSATRRFVKGAIEEMNSGEKEIKFKIGIQRAQIEDLSILKKKNVDIIEAYEERCSYLEKKIDRQQVSTEKSWSVLGFGLSKETRRRPLSDWRDGSLYGGYEDLLDSAKSLGSYSLNEKYGEDPLSKSMHSSRSFGLY